ncbi:lipoprotein insertase outer membrane protein LolB [Solimonas terrae]|uniref:Outer-membrane lipoprotein LolB n=1 Tax=Solimonas terrae TaxID=1396819 RepID=A0A6M2BQA4_9GAMM|nr:lipoprotein insertase outer membrane protein LolB [Solimonas terrae]NGY04385.1 outer membrane lipoprotein LolB [Solimonas terrae]
MIRLRIVRGAAVALLALCSACANLPSAPVDQAQIDARWRAHRDELAAITHFELNGRAASRLGVKADLRWQQFEDGHFNIRIAGPFGAGAVAIDGTPHDVEIRTKDGTEHTNDPQAWLLQRAGWTFPIDGLRWWVLGLPAPDTAAQIELDAQGRLATLTQDGWTLNYGDYQQVLNLDLPRRFEARNGQITLKLIADEWHDIETSRGHPPSS